MAASGAPEAALADLAVGIDPGGADAWEWQDLLATDVHVGAPPDLLGPDGQDWGLPPFVPWKLQAAGYAPFVATIRACLRHARGLRIDHVMGLFRLLWIPPGRTAADGAYVRSPGRDLLDIVALEATRAGALVVAPMPVFACSPDAHADHRVWRIGARDPGGVGGQSYARR